MFFEVEKMSVSTPRLPCKKPHFDHQKTTFYIRFSPKPPAKTTFSGHKKITAKPLLGPAVKVK
jgi:hypothetical protein